MEMILAVTNITVSVVMTLSGVFSDGVELMQKKDYAKAEKAFTKVIEAKDGGEIYVAPSLLMRAQCRLEMKAADKARKDIEILFAVDEAHKFWRAGADLYEKAGGKPASLLPKEKPDDVWIAFMDALRKEDGAAAVKYTDAAFTEVIVGALKSDEFDEVVEWLGENPFRGVKVTNVVARSAQLFCVGDQEPGLTVNFSRSGNKWKVSGMYPRLQDMDAPRPDLDDPFVDAEEQVLDDGDKVEELVTAISDYVMEIEAMPPELKDLLKGEHLEDKKSLVWEHPATGKQLPYIYMMKVVPDPDALARQYLLSEGAIDEEAVQQSKEFGIAELGAPILVAAPMPVNGKRSLGTGDGWVAIDEKDFAAMAVTQKWKIPGIENSLKASEETAGDVAECIAKMRKGSSSERKAARDRLIEMGVEALTEIRKYEDDGDPEIKESVKAIIKRLK